MESRRVFSSRLFLAVLAGLLVLNAFFFLYARPDGQADQQIYGADYHRIYQSHEGLTLEEAVQWCRDYEQAEQDRLLAGEWVYDGDKEREKGIVAELKGQYEYLLGYDDYLGNIQKQAKLLQTVSLFGDPDSISYKNTVKTSEDFAALDGIQVTAGHDRAVTSFLTIPGRTTAS